MDTSSIKWVTYADRVLSMRIPSGLEKVSNPRWITSGPLAGESAVTLAGCLDPQRVESKVTLIIYRDLSPTMITALEQMREVPILSPTFEGIEGLNRTLWRYRGPSLVRSGGTELRQSIVQPQAEVHRWMMAVPFGARWIQMDLISSPGALDWEPFEAIAAEIAKSINVTAAARARSTRKERPHGLTARAKAKLAKVLQSLPDQLAYLREPILALAQQDQDLLGSGGADTSELGKAIAAQASSRPEGFATTDAAELERWLLEASGSNDMWAAPVRFAQAFLVGFDLFDEDRRSV